MRRLRITFRLIVAATALVPAVVAGQSAQSRPAAPSVPPPPPTDESSTQTPPTATQGPAPGSTNGTAASPSGRATSDAFIDWTPGRTAPRPAAPRTPGTNGLLQSASSDGARAAIRNDTETFASATSGRGETERIGNATTSYWSEQMREGHSSFVPGSYDYFRTTRGRTRDLWQPPRGQEPSFVDAVTGTFFSPTDRAVEAWTRSLGPLATGVANAAVTALNNAHPNSPTLEPSPTMAARGRATARTVSAVIEVDQREDGSVAAMRVVRSNGGRAFSESAMRAVEQAIVNAPRPAMPGGWRSRWAFEQSTWRDPLVGLTPNAPGSGLPVGVTANAEIETDGEPGDTRFHAPGLLHHARVVRVISSERIVPAARAPAVH